MVIVVHHQFLWTTDIFYGGLAWPQLAVDRGPPNLALQLAVCSSA